MKTNCYPPLDHPDLVNKLIAMFSCSSDLFAEQPNPLDDFAKYGGIDAELLSIDLMDGSDFEQWCASTLVDMGFSDVSLTGGSGDQGVDIVATSGGIKYAIQCKRYSDTLGNSPIQEVHAGKSLYRCHVGTVITNQYFSKAARELADATGIVLWDRDWIKAYLATKADNTGALILSHGLTTEPKIDETIFQYDEILPAAIDLILESGSVSASQLKRKLKTSYTRSAMIIDNMEKLGIVSPFDGRNPRRVIITKDDWKAVCDAL